MTVIGIDPGRTGAFAFLHDGGIVEVVDMPGCDCGQTGNYDVNDIHTVLYGIKRAYGPAVEIGIEYPQSRPGEGAERSRNFGIGLGYLEMACVGLDLPYKRITPQEWKGRLGLPGKTKPDWKKRSAEMYDLFFPEQRSLIRGLRGGIKDGRLDAALIALFLYMQTANGMRTIVEKFGCDSDQAMMLMYGRGKKLRE